MTNPFTQPKPKYAVGGAVMLPSASGGFHVWKITGIYHGGLGCENLIGLRTLDRQTGTANGKIVKETLVPLPIFMAALKTVTEGK